MRRKRLSMPQKLLTILIYIPLYFEIFLFSKGNLTVLSPFSFIMLVSSSYLICFPVCVFKMQGLRCIGARVVGHRADQSIYLHCMV